jgi:hypothetical protein
MKSTESPATSLLALTNILQPVVRRCRFGCPEMTCEQQMHQQGLEIQLEKNCARVRVAQFIDDSSTFL